MATPVVTETWAGNLDCTTCSRKRLTADQFSKKAVELYSKHGKALRCKQCVEDTAQKERETAAAARNSLGTSASTTATNETRTCAACQAQLNQSAFNKSQWNKGDGVSRCRACVEAAVKQDVIQRETLQAEKLAAAVMAVDEAKKSGNTMAILKAESVVAAL
jgi:Stc1 domain